MATPTEPSYRQRITYQSMLLGGFATFAAVFLVSGNLATRDAIAERQKEDMLASLNQVVPATLYRNDLLDNPLHMQDANGQVITIYRGFDQSQVSALAWEVMGNGYAGDIRLIMGLDPDGKILGVRIIAHAETPGLGDKIEVQKDDWILGFNGLGLGNPPAKRWKVKKDGGEFDAFSGATITPRAVVAAIHDGLEFFKANRGHLLAMPQDAVSGPVASNTSTEGVKP
jgi:electron transport complex protein RnfG